MVEEYEANGKTGKRRTKVGAAFAHKDGLASASSSRAIPLDGRLVVIGIS